ncbi:3995_t:CDS:2 [Funneliformis geosporum]|nr:3995_t:CDS:2 [Funneliformis geosporum]
MSCNHILSFHFLEPETSYPSEKKESKNKEPNMFISFQKWKNFSEEAKVELQRQYQIKRDQKLRRDEIADQCIANHERRNKYKRRLQKNVTEQIEISLNNHVLSNQSETNQLQRA